MVSRLREDLLEFRLRGCRVGVVGGALEGRDVRVKAGDGLRDARRLRFERSDGIDLTGGVALQRRQRAGRPARSGPGPRQGAAGGTEGIAVGALGRVGGRACARGARREG
jgi:hypothetical protein